MKPVLHKLIREAEPYQGLFYFSMVCMFMSGLENVLPSWLVKVSIDGLAALNEGRDNFKILPTQVEEFLSSHPIDIIHSLNWSPENWAFKSADLQYFLPLLIIGVFIIDAIFKFLHQYSIRKVGLLVVRRLREKFHYHLNRMSLTTQAKYDSGSLVSVITSDLHNLQSWLAESVTNLFNDGFKALFLFVWLLMLDWKLTILSAVVIPLFGFPVLHLGKRIRAYSRSGQDYIGTLTSFISESLYNQKIIKAFNLQEWRQKNFIKESNILYDLHKKWVLFMALVSPVTNIIGAAGIAAILYFGLGSVVRGSISVGEFSSFFVTTILLYDPIKRIGRVSSIIQSALGVAERVFDILEEPAQEDSGHKSSFIKLPRLGEVEFRQVSYRHAGKSDRIFEDINLLIPAKSSLGIVGPSGSGKTTLVSLIPRFFELDSGDILIDGVKIRDLSLEELRSQIALVTQDPLLFTGSIRDNILLGDTGGQELEAKIMQAAKDAHVLEFSSQLDKGLDTYIGERGQNLSVGQRQRVALARAFISDAPIVILDEPTSALDNQSQTYIYDSIRKLMQKKTVLIIAHRLSTVESCDKIVYMEEGKIIESGTHHELMSKGSAYASLLLS
jgi:subfamily B ATP-binding cassette protein MsbA